MTAVVGWTLKPEGMCRDAVCVPLPRGRDTAYLRDGLVNVAAFWRYTERPWARSAAGDVWAFGANARERADALLSLQAPDFTLPDLAGNPHALSDHRGRKVFLVTWASW
ncbi:MAG: redoxin domain-containing protein [Alphaproteobacteria bacterium]|nr:redoxin domain-containing protein [Alphaproteobacteria bacterium]